MSVLGALIAIVEAVHEEVEPSKAPFYVAGSVLAAWAVVISAFALRRPDFPESRGRGRLVMAFTALLVVSTIGAAIGTS